MYFHSSNHNLQLVCVSSNHILIDSLVSFIFDSFYKSSNS